MGNKRVAERLLKEAKKHSHQALNPGKGSFGAFVDAAIGASLYKVALALLEESGEGLQNNGKGGSNG